ncbi:hypothetical protein MPS_5022 [Mycobacterium pseudoshottsii JCM 15466]|nr:hypothetical protein MMSP_0606 [Mycobacterium sp. 012931]EPQ70867.1 hypothetical protein MMMB2_4701 [Mycobacterium marinum MB2]GAQ40086.1 hypothetical protein MPS_5022 [Mycobacterium pseudoshottsii JCM 15466]
MYFKPGLHPDDVDHSENLETWREKYLGRLAYCPSAGG